MYIQRDNDEMREMDINRFATKVDSDKVIVPTTALNDISAKPKWDAFENNHFAMRRRLVNIFLRVSNKLICRLRAGHRLTKIKNWISSNGIRTREEMKAMVAEDYKIAQNYRQTGEDGSENDITNMRFSFKFNQTTIGQGM